MRNEESHFSVNPVNLDIGRSRFERSPNKKFTGNVGDIIPFYWTEILPGDTVKMKTSAVVRTSTLLDPVMDTLYCDFYYHFVPMRLVWDHTKEFFGENTSGPWYPQTTYTIPQITTSSSSSVVQPGVQSVADYMGLPIRKYPLTSTTSVDKIVPGISVSHLPIRSYTKVYLDWFIDQNTMTPPIFYTGDTTQYFNATRPDLGGVCFKACKLHDYFTSCLPSAQRGPAVQIPLGGTIPVSLGGSVANLNAGTGLHALSNALRWGYDANTPAFPMLSEGTVGGFYSFDNNSTNSDTEGMKRIVATNLQVRFPNSVTADLSGASPITVNDLRLAFQMQKWYEKSALFGGRYIEMLKAQFGVTSPDARLQRSEYLGGCRFPLNVQQVENNTAGSTPLGHLGAFSATSDVNEDFTHSFTEHGFLIGTVVVRYKNTYTQGIERAWSRLTMWDHYFPLMANLGNMAVLSKEIYADGSSSDNDVFGYQEAWADYRYQPDSCCGYMRPDVSGSLASWHYADNYASRPTLSAPWMECDKTNVDRTLAVTSSAAPQLLFDVKNEAVFVRAMPLYSIPGLIDHH